MKFFIFFTIVFYNAVSFSQSKIYVSQSGNDKNKGTVIAPVKTIHKAKQLVKALKKSTDVEVIIGEGNYFVDKTLLFTSEDGGSENVKITYKAAPGEKVCISGGKEVKEWGNFKDGIYKTKLPGHSFRQLYVNNKRAVRARYPDTGAYNRLEGRDLKNHFFIMKKDAVPGWHNIEGSEIVLQTYWSESYVHFNNYKEATGGLVNVFIRKDQAGILFPRPNPAIQQDAVFHFENSLSLLNQPGEWFFDKVAETLYYKPFPGEDINTLKIIIPVTETLLSVQGTLDNPVKNLSFEGLTFEYANWDLPTVNGHINMQAGMYNTSAESNNDQRVARPVAAVKAKNAHRVVFENNLFRHLGSTGIDLEQGTKECVVNGNVFHSISGNGILTGAFTATPEALVHIPYNPDDKRQICTDDVISNNLITNIACDYYGCCAITTGYAAGIKIIHNEIRNTPYSGISLGYGWTLAPNAMQDNFIAYNEITDVLKTLCDGGAIYILSMQPGTKIIENYVHDFHRSKWAGSYPMASIYLDQAASGTNEKPLLLERNSLPMPDKQDKTIKSWNIHRAGILLFKNNDEYVIDDVKKNAGIEAHLKEKVYAMLQ